MLKTKGLVKKHSLLIYFILTFVISWGAVLVLAGPDGIPVASDQAARLGMALLLGPSLSSILLIGLTSGRDGYRILLLRLFAWKVTFRWYAIALLIAPLSTVVVLLLLSLISTSFIPAIFVSDAKASLVLMAVIAGLMVGIFEELGWTGFAVHGMVRKYNVYTTGILVGLIWGAWHFIMFWESDSFTSVLPFAILLARLFAWLPAYRILMVSVYQQTESLLVVILMHVSLVASLIILEPALKGEELLAYILVKAVVLWLIVGVFRYSIKTKE